MGSTPAYLMAGAGVLLGWSALKGKNLDSVAHAVVTGKNPLTASNDPILSVPSGIAGDSSGGGGSSSGNAIVAQAQQGLGVMYKWGGGNASGWDCSGFGNDVFAELGIELPGGITSTGDWMTRTYSNGPHGPTTVSYYFWPGATTVPYSQAQPGDIAVWLTHMGIVTGPNTMINAYQTGKPTAQTSIKGMGIGLGPLRIRRLNSASGGSASAT